MTRLWQFLLLTLVLLTTWQTVEDDPVIRAQTPGQILSHVPPGCGWIYNEKPGVNALVCNKGKLRGFRDWEGGVYIPGHPKSLNVNIGGGSSRKRGYVVLSPDIGKGTILEDGHLNKLALFRGKQHGGTQFRIQPTFKRGLIACDSKGCVDVMKLLRAAGSPSPSQ